MPQRARAQKGVGPFLSTGVAPIFGPRGVAKLVRSTAATTLRLAPDDLPKIRSNVAYVGFFNSLLVARGADGAGFELLAPALDDLAGDLVDHFLEQESKVTSPPEI